MGGKSQRWLLQGVSLGCRGFVECPWQVCDIMGFVRAGMPAALILEDMTGAGRFGYFGTFGVSFFLVCVSEFNCRMSI